MKRPNPYDATPARRTDSRQGSASALTAAPASPLLYLSSEHAGWEGLVAQAFHEPREYDGWTDPATPDVSLVLFAGGAMRIEVRPVNGPWTALHVRHGELLLNPGATTSYEVRWKSLSAAPMQTLHLRLSKEVLSRTAEEVAGCDPARLSLSARSGFHDPLLAQMGFALWRELAERPPAGKLYAQAAAQVLALHLVRHYAVGGRASAEPARVLTQQQLRRVQDRVQSDLGHDLSLEALAAQTGYSPYHFARLFRQTTGESPHQFVLRQRIEHAQHGLEATDAPLAEIAAASGFASQSHLTQAFRRHLGLTPRVYRQQRSIVAGFRQKRTDLEDHAPRCMGD